MRSFTALRALAVCAAVLLTGHSVPATAYPPYDLTVKNGSSRDMIAFYATSSNRRGWGRDHLRDDILEPGYQIKLNLADGYGTCIFDLKAVMRGGGVITRYGLNVCTTDWWRVYDN